MVVTSEALSSGNRYRIMVMVPGERKLELTLTVVRNYSVPQLQPANLPRAGPKALSIMITLHDRKGGQAVPELCYHVRQTSRSHID